MPRPAPAPLPADVSGRIQQALDLRAPGAGQLSPDGSRLYFGWSITGTPQLWRLDSPKGFPIQMTGGEDRTGLSAVSPDGTFLVVDADGPLGVEGAPGAGLLLLASVMTAMHLLIIVGFMPLARRLASRLGGSVRLHITYADGTETRLVSDPSWQVHPSPVTAREKNPTKSP